MSIDLIAGQPFCIRFLFAVERYEVNESGWIVMGEDGAGKKIKKRQHAPNGVRRKRVAQKLEKPLCPGCGMVGALRNGLTRVRVVGFKGLGINSFAADIGLKSFREFSEIVEQSE